MKILLDENLPHKLRPALGTRDCVTVSYMGWDGLKNGELLRAAEEKGISVLVTGDKTLRYEQSIIGRNIAVVVLSAQKWTILRDHLREIGAAIDAAKAWIVHPGKLRSLSARPMRPDSLSDTLILRKPLLRP